MAKTVAELAPLLSDNGISEEEIKVHAHAPAKDKPVGQHAIIQPKRYREAMALIVGFPDLTDEKVASQVASMRPEVVAQMRAELAAVKADPEAKTKVEVEDAKGNGK